jgi:hypothetical protein
VIRFRDFIREISPPWLRREWGEKYLYAPGVLVDGVTEWMLQGVRARFPQKGTPTALGAIGRDRRIVRGFAETDAAYQVRLLKWLDSWRIAGNPVAMLEQLAGYLSPFEVRIRTVSHKGTWFTREPDGTIEIHRKQGNWDWDGEPPQKWSRFWVIIYPLASGVFTEGPSYNTAQLYGGGYGLAPTATRGTTATIEQVVAIRQLVREWKPAGTRCIKIIIAFDAASFDPTDPPGAPLPDGLWGNDAKVVAGTYVPSRLSTARYWAGTS